LRVECVRAGRGTLEVLDHLFDLLGVFATCFATADDTDTVQKELRMLAVLVETFNSIIVVHAVGSQATFTKTEFDFLMRYQMKLLRNWQHLRELIPTLVRAPTLIQKVA